MHTRSFIDIKINVNIIIATTHILGRCSPSEAYKDCSEQFCPKNSLASSHTNPRQKKLTILRVKLLISHSSIFYRICLFQSSSPYQ